LVSNQPSLTLIATVFLVISNYVFLVILIVINWLIYRELKRIMTKKNFIVGNLSNLKTAYHDSLVMTEDHRHINAIAPTLIIHTNSDYQEAKGKSSVRRSLIMTLWISVIFSSDRFMKCVYRTMVLINPFWQATIYLNAVSYIFDMIVYSSFFFVYMHTNKMFKKKFYQIFLRRRF
jgi:hypothetical protein